MAVNDSVFIVKLTEPRYILPMQYIPQPTPPSYQRFLRHNFAYSILKFALELLAGLFILLALAIGSTTWWLGIAENRQLAQSFLNDEINKHLGTEQQIAVQDINFTLSTQPFGAKVILYNALFSKTDLKVNIPKSTLSFSLDDLIAERYLPKIITIEGLNLTNPVTTTTKTHPNSQLDAWSQFSAALMLWLAPEYSDRLNNNQVFAHITEIRLRNLQANFGTGNIIKGHFVLHRQAQSGLTFDGIINENLKTQFSIDRLQDDVQLRINSILPANIIPDIPALGTAKAWLQEMGQSGQINGSAQISLHTLIQLKPNNMQLSALRSLSALRPLDIQAELHWPLDSPALQLHIHKTAGNDVQLNINSLQPVLLPNIPNMPNITAKTARIAIAGNLDSATWQLNDSTIALADQTTIQSNGTFNVTTQTAQLNFNAKNITHQLLPSFSLPEPMVLTKGRIADATGHMQIDRQTVALDHVKGTAQDIAIAVDTETAHIPKLDFEWQKPNRLQLNIARMRIPANLAEHWIQQFAPSLAIQPVNEMEVAGKLAIDTLQNSVDIHNILALEPLKFQILNQPVSIAALHYSATDNHRLEFTGQLTNFANQEFRVSSSENEANRVTVINAPKLPVALLKNLWQQVTEQTPFDNINGHIGLDATVQNTNSLNSIAIKANIDNAAMTHPTFGTVKSIGTQGYLNLTAQRETKQQWQIHIDSDTENFGGNITLTFDNQQQKVLAIAPSSLRFLDDRLQLSASRTQGALQIDLASQTWHAGTALIDIAKDDTTDIPEILAPLQRLSWDFADSFHAGDIRLGKGNVTIHFNAEHADTDTTPSLNLNFIEPEPIATQKKTDTTITQHIIDYIPQQRLIINSPNAGKLLRALSITNSISGGVFQASLSPQNNQLDGTVQLDNFTVQDTSAAVNFLQAISLTGLLPLLANDGLSFFTLNATASIKEKIWQLDDLVTFGPSLSMTFAGTLDTSSETINGSGTASPTSIFNATLGRIPLIGQILTGTDGAGLVAVNYTVTGDIHDPKIKTEPLSILQLGILRNIIDGIRGN